MAVTPDPREGLWYDIMRLMDVDPDNIPHYWTMVIDRFRLLRMDKKRPVCKTCNTTYVFEDKNELLCSREYDVIEDDDGKETIVKRNEFEKPHDIVFETSVETMGRMIRDIIDYLEEPTGNKMTLFSLESYMLGKDEDDYFETMYNGDVTKSKVKEMFFKIKEVLIEDLTEIRDQIRFTSVLRTPPITR